MPPSIKLTKPAAPQFSISGRIKDPNERRIDSGVGPGKYVLKDGIGGRSSLSHRKTAASFKFMQGKRDGGIFQPDYAPGPGSYTLPRGIGTQSDSNLRTAPAIAMAGREKFGSLASLSETIGPGPGGGSLVKKGLQQLITQKQAPQAVFSRGRRDASSKASSEAPGPGSYKNAGRVLALSQYSSPPRISLSGRPKIPSSSMNSAGPGKVRDDTAIGKQALSHRRSYGGFTFGSRTSLGIKNQSGPGPGAYG